MNITIWKLLISVSLLTILLIIGVSVWALDHSYIGLARTGLEILFIMCIACCSWLMVSISTIFKSLEETLDSMQLIKIGITEAKELLKEYGSCTRPHDK